MMAKNFAEVSQHKQLHSMKHILKKSGLGSLRRTASHLLNEWEKSLTPSPGQEYTGEDYLGASAEAAAFGVAGKGKND